MSSYESESGHRLIQQLQAESQRQKFSEQVSTLSSRCFDICFTDSRPPSKMDHKHQTCITNCVDRMLDASEFMVEHLQKSQLAK
ncbi:Mitochondrial import inner membrane translocase subunit [Aphelenchoides besseyi]|nr:Mitochondrial import inner membrane translocase subunit [Aphelenchoides besseyi]KAI6192578.1 Mitochondrial import inner membrane translocase subunit [Aphelenchoides besseyi]